MLLYLNMSLLMHQSIPAAPPPRATAGHLPALSVPRVGHLQILHCPGAGHLPTPNFWHARSFLSQYNYTEDFTGKTSRLAYLSRTGKNWRGLYRHVLDFMHAFLHCLSSQNYIAKSGAIDVNQSFLWLLNEISVVIIWRTFFHIYNSYLYSTLLILMSIIL